MKKIFIPVIILVLVILAGWFLLRDKEIPLVETIVDGLPFGSGENQRPTTNDLQPKTEEGDGGSNQLGGETAKLMRISDTPVAGFVVLKNAVRYVDRATGHIYDFNLATRERVKIVNQTLPKIYEAHFKPDGNTVLLRYLKNDSDTVENLSLTLTPPPTATSSLYKITSTLLRGYTGPVAINSPFTDWAFSDGKKVVAYTKPSSDAPGYAYSMSASGGLSKILGPLNGLVALINADGSRILYSHVEDGETKLFSRSLANNSSSEVLPATLAEKCVWSAKNAELVFCGVPAYAPKTGELDNWYKGAIHFSDNLWSFDTDTEVAQFLAEPKVDISTDLDVYQPKLSPNEDYLVFINKNDLSLWAL